jgi:hypothetical protein
MTTIQDIHAAINPLPAKLSKKGKVKPEVTFVIEANAAFNISMSWMKPFSNNDWEHEYECFLGDDFATIIRKAVAFIDKLPTAKQAQLNHFMGKLGKLIDAGKDAGIEVDYLNPLLETMKRLSENIITHQPKHHSPQETEQ